MQCVRHGSMHASIPHLLDEIVPTNRFYARKARTRIFFTTKQELIDDQAANPPYGTNLTFPLDRYTRFCQTSGTSGHPLHWLDTTESWNWMLGNWDRVYQAAGVTAQDHIFFAFSFGPFLGFWTAFEAATRMGALAIPGGGMRTSVRLHTILDTRATVLCCTPTYAIRLAEAAAEAHSTWKTRTSAASLSRENLAAASLRRARTSRSCGPARRSSIITA